MFSKSQRFPDNGKKVTPGPGDYDIKTSQRVPLAQFSKEQRFSDSSGLVLRYLVIFLLNCRTINLSYWKLLLSRFYLVMVCFAANVFCVPFGFAYKLLNGNGALSIRSCKMQYNLSPILHTPLVQVEVTLIVIIYSPIKL